MSHRRVLCSLVLLASVFALGACGRRGPLEPPPGASVPRSQITSVEPGVQSNPTAPSLARGTSDGETFNRGNVIAPPVATSPPQTPFILDPLL